MKHLDFAKSGSSLAQTAKQLLEDVLLPPQTELRLELDSLVARQRQRELPAEESTRLYQVIDEIENANVERWRSIGELARVRRYSLIDLADEWKSASNRALQEVWDNDEDAAYDDL